MGFLQLFKRKPSIKDIPPELSDGLTKNQTDLVESRSLALFTQQWDFYRIGYYSMLRVSTIKDVIIGVLLLITIILSSQGAPVTHYVAVDADGKITKLEPLDMPALSDEQIRAFTKEAIADAFNFNYLDIDKRTIDAAKYFTDKGYNSYMNAIKMSGLREQIADKRLLVKTTVNGTPIIKDKGQYGGRFVWTVTVDVTRTLTDRVKSQDSAVTYTFYMYRVPSTERTSQVAIYQYNQIMTQ